MTTLVAAVFRAAYVNGNDQIAGFLVPDTDNTLAVHLRWDRNWQVTHIPSGRGVMPPYGARFIVSEQAVGFSQRFYAQMLKLGADMKEKDFEVERRRVWDRLVAVEREEFWAKVL